MSETTTTAPRFPNRWALFPVGLLGILVSVQAVLFTLSKSDPSFAIEPGYYQKAVDWDKQVLQEQASVRLGWQSRALITTSTLGSTLQVELQDREGVLVRGANVQAEAFANARAALVQRLSLPEVAPGIYRGDLNFIHPGEWEVRLDASRGGDRYTHALRVSQPAASKE